MSRVRVMLSMLVAALAAIGGFSIGRVGTQGGTEPAPGSSPVTPRYTNWSIVDPVNQTFTDYRDNGTNPGIAMPANEGDLFCAGHAWDAHGRLFVAGGEREVADGDPILGGRLAYLFDPSRTGGSGASSTQWIRQMDSSGVMAKYRYYPTVTLTASGSMLVIGGTEDSSQADENNYETFSPPGPTGTQGTWQTFTVGGNPVRLFPGPDSSQISADGFNQYDWVHLLSTGDVFRAGSAARSSRWTPREHVCTLRMAGTGKPHRLVHGVLPDLRDRGSVPQPQLELPGHDHGPGW